MNKIFLLADDDSDDADMFQEVLSEIDPTIIFHRSWDGCGVLENLKDKSLSYPDIIFLDINMPRMNGWQCLTQLKDNEAFRDIPIIIYSTSSHSKDAELAIEMGALCFITKPNDFNTLKSILEIIVINMASNLPKAMREIADIAKPKKLAICAQNSDPKLKNKKK